MQTKVCSICGEEKPVDQFALEKRLKSGRRADCKTCCVTRNRERRQHDPEFQSYNYRYEQERRKRDPEYNKKWLEYKRKKNVEYRSKNPDKAKERAKKEAQRRSSDPALRKKYTDYERNRRHERQKSDPAFHDHLMDLAKRGYHKRRARIAQTGGSYTRSEWRKLCEFYDHRCLCCGMKFQRLTVDHVLPLSKGGTNNIQNIQPLCRSCNSRKHDKEIDYRYTLPPWFGEDV